MKKNSLGPFGVMGFAQYEKQQSVETEDLIRACLTWRREFLDRQPGIGGHVFLGNTKGRYADAIFATDRASYEAMAENHPKASSSSALMSLLRPNSICLTPCTILKEDFEIPDDFSCIEFGTFTPHADGRFSENRMLDVSNEIEASYLLNKPEARRHFMGKVSETSYAEVAFVQTLGAAQEICFGYTQDKTCRRLLEMFEPASVDLDFWFVLA